MELSSMESKENLVGQPKTPKTPIITTGLEKSIRVFRK